jgi:hypothetical protein
MEALNESSEVTEDYQPVTLQFFFNQLLFAHLVRGVVHKQGAQVPSIVFTQEDTGDLWRYDSNASIVYIYTAPHIQSALMSFAEEQRVPTPEECAQRAGEHLQQSIFDASIFWMASQRYGRFHSVDITLLSGLYHMLLWVLPAGIIALIMMACRLITLPEILGVVAALPLLLFLHRWWGKMGDDLLLRYQYEKSFRGRMGGPLIKSVLTDPQWNDILTVNMTVPEPPEPST